MLESPKSVGKLFPHPVGVFCTILEPPQCHIMQTIKRTDADVLHVFSVFLYMVCSINRVCFSPRKEMPVAGSYTMGWLRFSEGAGPEKKRLRQDPRPRGG